MKMFLSCCRVDQVTAGIRAGILTPTRSARLSKLLCSSSPLHHGRTLRQHSSPAQLRSFSVANGVPGATGKNALKARESKEYDEKDKTLQLWFSSATMFTAAGLVVNDVVINSSAISDVTIAVAGWCWFYHLPGPRGVMDDLFPKSLMPLLNAKNEAATTDKMKLCVSNIATDMLSEPSDSK